ARTMSKAFGMAGLRLGYLAADTALIDHLRVVRLPYHLSALTQAAALAALRHREELMAQIASLRSERDRLVTWLRGRGLQVADSDANFVLFGVLPDRHRVWKGLLDRGILIREVGPDGWLRVSVRSEEHTSELQSRENLVCRLLLEKKKQNTSLNMRDHQHQRCTQLIEASSRCMTSTQAVANAYTTASLSPGMNHRNGRLRPHMKP